jgi:outer membrane protein
MIFKKVLALVLCSLALTGFARAGEESFRLIGAGALVSQSPYRGVDNKVSPLFSVVWDKGPFYVRGIEAGYKFYNEAPLTAKVIIAPRLMGYRASYSDALSGMDDRLWSVDGGIGVDWALPYGKDMTLSFKAVNDLLSRHDGRAGEATLSKKFKHRYLEVIPSLGVRVLSSELTDYYYGVEPSETRADRSAYHPGHAVNYVGGIMLNSGFSRDWIVITRFGVEALDAKIRKSPLVDENLLLSAMLGLTRRF